MIRTEAWFVTANWRERLDALWEGLDGLLPQDADHLRKRIEGLERFIKYQGAGMCVPGRLSVQKALDGMEQSLATFRDRARYR